MGGLCNGVLIEWKYIEKVFCYVGLKLCYFMSSKCWTLKVVIVMGSMGLVR